MNKIKIALIQEDLIWEDSNANTQLFEKYLDKIDGVDVVVLPEMFNTGFTMEPEKVAQKIKGSTVRWMQDIAVENNYSVMGSMVIEEDGEFYNRFVMSYPCTDVKWYDKRHLFRMGGENEKYAPGSQSVIFKYFGWRIRPLVCYDLRFPVWSRNRNDYDLLIYVANWPAVRNEVWEILLKARALENQCYVIGVNRVGEDGRGIKYKGNSMVIDPKGQIIEQMDDKPGYSIVTLDMSDLQIFREKFPVHLDADDFAFKNGKD